MDDISEDESPACKFTTGLCLSGKLILRNEDALEEVSSDPSIVVIAVLFNLHLLVTISRYT